MDVVASTSANSLQANQKVVEFSDYIDSKKPVEKPEGIGSVTQDALADFYNLIESNSSVDQSAQPNALKQAQQELMPGPAELMPDGLASVKSQETGFENTMNIMSNAFDKAIQTSLVVRVGTQSQGAINTLMKGQ